MKLIVLYGFHLSLDIENIDSDNYEETVKKNQDIISIVKDMIDLCGYEFEWEKLSKDDSPDEKEGYIVGLHVDENYVAESGGLSFDKSDITENMKKAIEEFKSVDIFDMFKDQYAKIWCIVHKFHI